MDETQATEAPKQAWHQKAIEFFEAVCNMFFYLFAFFVLIIPPLKWVSDWMNASSSSWMVLVAAIVFGMIVPAIAPLLADKSMTLMERVRKGEWMGFFFRPLRAACAVLSMYGVLALEYSVIHSDSGKSMFEVYFQLLKSL